MSRLRPLHWIVAALAVTVLALSLWRLETARGGLEITAVEVGTTPTTLYRLPGGDRRLVVISHGFAGSRQLMEAWSLTLAQSGLAVLAFDYQGHGRNTVPMSGDVTSVEGTTQRLVDETRRVIDAGLALPGVTGPVALLGHSMATDVIVRTAAADPRVTDIVAVSMYSEAVTPEHPTSLLTVTGQWEPHLREAALTALRMLDPEAQEGDTATAGDLRRRAVVAPAVEHVGALYSATGLAEARDWLGGEPVPAAATGGAVLGMLTAIVALGWPLSRLLPRNRAPTAHLSRGRLAIAVLLPAVLAPLIATRIDTGFLRVLVADYLMVHLLILGLLQLAILRVFSATPGPLRPVALAALLIWGLVVFGGALDSYVASFWPSGDRWTIVALLALGAVPAMLADATLTDAGQAPLWRRLAAKAGFFLSLALAVALDFEGLFFLLIVLPVIVLFFLVYGLLGRWAGRDATASTVGLGLGLILAWALGVTFPLFVA